MEVRKGMSKREKANLVEAGCFVMDYSVNGEIYTYIIRPVVERSNKEWTI